MRIVGTGGDRLVYTGGLPDIVLTSVARNLAPSGVPDAPARAVVGTLSRLQQILTSKNLAWSAPVQEIRSSVAEMFTLNGAPVVLNSINRMTVHGGPKRSPNTIQAWIHNLRRGFDQLILLGNRVGENPLESLAQKRGAVKAHAAAVRNPEQATGYKRTPIGVFRLSPSARGRRRLVTFRQIDLPARIKRAGKQAKWGNREWVVFYILVDSGARVAEACEVSMAGLALSGLGCTLWLRNKWSGGAPVKQVVLSEAGCKALEQYFLSERQAQDPRALAFETWAVGRPYTLENYLHFLIALKIDPATVPLLLNNRKMPLRTKSFRDDHWARMRHHARLESLAPHHLRHWYINNELDRIEREYGQDRQRHQAEIYRFIDRMHWTDPQSLLAYDHSGRIYRLMDWHLRPGLNRTAPESNGVSAALGFSNAQASGLTGPQSGGRGQA